MSHSFSSISTPIGVLRVYCTDAAITAISLPTDDPPTAPPGEHALHREASDQLLAYFAGTLRAFDLPLAPAGTPFQAAVWAGLQTIPFGETRTYRDMAEALGRPTATRAVGAANGKNPIAIVVPCHRVIGADGSLTGYAGGLATKAWLLRHEGLRHVPEQTRLLSAERATR
jgi:methylated-DNA-[protein]-cysteine S-methyltransferase